jgi:hypothetical protein
MGHSIPVFFIPIDRSEYPRELNKWDDVSDILNKYCEREDKSSFRVATSRNWWLERILDEACKALGILGFDFITKEISLLDYKELRAAQSAIKALQEKLINGKIEIDAKTVVNEIWGFSEHDIEIEYGLLFYKAYQEAEPFYDSYVVDGFYTYKGVVEFFSFLKTLDVVITEALESNNFLLVVQPQP